MKGNTDDHHTRGPEELYCLLQEIAAKYGALSEEDGVAFRATYLINPEGVLEHISINNMGIGRNIDETKRVLQAVQFVAEHGEVCPESIHAPPPHADNASPVASHLKIDAHWMGITIATVNGYPSDLQSYSAVTVLHRGRKTRSSLEGLLIFSTSTCKCALHRCSKDDDWQGC